MDDLDGRQVRRVVEGPCAASRRIPFHDEMLLVNREAWQALRALMRPAFKENTKAALTEACLKAVALADQVCPINIYSGVMGEPAKKEGM